MITKLLKSALFIIVLIGLYSCQNTTPSVTHMVVVVDVTSADRSVVPSAESLINMIKKNHTSPEDGLIVSFTLLDDLSGAPFAEEEWAPAEGHAAMENPVKRKRLAEEFYQNVQNRIKQQLDKTQIDKDYSKIYIKLCKSAQYLSQSDAQIKKMVVYSDFLENSEFASFYKDSELQKAQSNPIQFYESQLKQACVLPDLSGVTIYMNVFRNPATDVKINKAEKFWVEMFEAQGAVIKMDSF